MAGEREQRIREFSNAADVSREIGFEPSSSGHGLAERTYVAGLRKAFDGVENLHGLWPQRGVHAGSAACG